MMDQERWFPIQGEHGTEYDAEGRITRHWERPAGRVPWAVAEAAYQVYARMYGRDQSLQKLAARGGFGWYELTWLLKGGDRCEGFEWLPFASPPEPEPDSLDERRDADRRGAVD